MNSEVISAARRLQAANDRGNLFGLRPEFAEAIRVLIGHVLDERKPLVFKVGDNIRWTRANPNFWVQPGQVLPIYRIDLSGDAWVRDDSQSAYKEVCIGKTDFEVVPVPLVSQTGIYEQRDGGEARVTDVHCVDSTWVGRSSDGAERVWRTNGEHYFAEADLDLIRFLRPLDASPALDGERQVGDAPVIDHGELKQLAREIYLRSLNFSDGAVGSVVAASCFELAELFLTESARREGEEC